MVCHINVLVIKLIQAVNWNTVNALAHTRLNMFMKWSSSRRKKKMLMVDTLNGRSGLSVHKIVDKANVLESERVQTQSQKERVKIVHLLEHQQNLRTASLKSAQLMVVSRSGRTGMHVAKAAEEVLKSELIHARILRLRMVVRTVKAKLKRAEDVMHRRVQLTEA